jgi:molecular chaperone HscB
MSINSPNPSLAVLADRENEACWSCGDMRAAHFCTSCGKVQPPHPVDFFAFFGLPKKLNVDLAKLEREFYLLSRKLHPDVYAQADEQEREWSLEQSSRLNDAYRALKDPIKRTQYLLRLEGVELEEQSKSATEKARATGEMKKQVVPPELLEEVFELNMQLEEARMNKKMDEDDPSLNQEIQEQKTNLEKKYEALLSELSGCWNDWDSAVDADSEAGRAQARGRMVDLLNRRTYIRNLVRDVNEVLES